MSIDATELRSRLRNFRTRARAIDDAVAAGESVVDVILPLLQDRNESLRWSGIKILSELGSDRAIPALIEALRRGEDSLEVVEALRNISNQSFGDDADTWERWSRGEEVATEDASATDGATAPSASGGPGSSNKALILEATRDTDVEIQSESDQLYVVTLPFADGRSQRVWVAFDQKDLEGEPLVQLCTPCGAADPDRHEWALKLNMSIPYGAIGIAKLGDDYCFAIVDSYLRSVASPAQIAKSLMMLANEGDRIEQLLSKDDRY